MILRQILTLLALLPFLFSSSAQCAEWNGGEDWDLFDCQARRAMWVWSPVSVTGSNSENRSWDPTSSAPRNAQARFFENYKGSQDLFFDFCENKSIRVLYFFNAVWEWDMADLDSATPRVPNEAEFVNFVAEAKSRGIQVWLMAYLWDAPNDSRMTQAANKQSIKLMAEAVDNFNTTYPTTPLAGVHLDQEPGEISVYNDLLDTMKIAQDWVDANCPDLIISQALRPKWRNQYITWNGETKSMNDHIMDTIGHGAYMSYNDDTSIVKNWLTPIIDYATTNHKKIASGFEVTDYQGLWANADEETWWEEIRNEPIATRFKVDPSGPVTFEDAMHDIVDSYENEAGFDRQVVHSYADYFEHWFGERPRDYILGLPNGEYDSVTQNPAKVNLYQDTRALVGINPFEEAPIATESTYPLTVVNGSGDERASEGSTIDIIAHTAPSGYHFINWSTADGGSFSDAYSATTTYTMPSNTAAVTANYQLNDSDDNNLNDAWEITHFGSVGATEYTADDDGDGYTNFEEMVFDLDPNIRDSAKASFAIQIVHHSGTNMMEFTFRRPLNFSSLDVSYQLERCSNLCVDDWTADPAEKILSDDGITQWVTFLLPLDQERAFYRCQVSPTL